MRKNFERGYYFNLEEQCRTGNFFLPVSVKNDRKQKYCFSELKLLSFVLNSSNVLDTLISFGRLFHYAAPLKEKLFQT